MNQVSLESQRYKLAAEVRLQREGYPAVRGQLHDISLSGLYVSTGTTYPAGTQLQFEVFPEDPALQSFEGIATVAWRRQLSAGALRPAGMGCEFQEVPPQALSELREWILTHPQLVIPRKTPDRSSLTTELSRFKITSVEKTTAQHDVGVYRARHMVARQAPSRWRSWLPLGIIGLLFAAVVLAYFQPWRSTTERSQRVADRAATQPGPSDASSGESIEAVASAATPEETGENAQNATSNSANESDIGQSTAEPSSTPASEEQNSQREPTTLTSEAEPSAEPPPASDSLSPSSETSPQTPGDPTPSTNAAIDPQSVRLAVRQWAAAWSAQDVDSYLDFYSGDFEPGGGQSLDQWRTTRRDRLTRPSFIRVSIQDIEVEASADEPGVVIARFRQEYQAPNYNDEVRKTLRLRNVGGSWQIVRESSSPL